MKSLNELNLNAKKYIIFDMDGTLIDSIGIWNQTDQRLIEEYGHTTISLEEAQLERDTFLHNHQSTDIYLAYCTHLITKYGLSIKDPHELLRIRFAISGEILEKEMDFKPNVAELILKLKSLGFTLVLATMTTQFQIDIYSKKNQKMLAKMNIAEVFDLITRQEDVQNKKPDPEIYNLIMTHYHATPEECLIFEDSYTGVASAVAAGIEVVNVYDAYSDIDRDKINQLSDYAISNYQEFLTLVNNTFAHHSRIREKNNTAIS